MQSTFFNSITKIITLKTIGKNIEFKAGTIKKEKKDYSLIDNNKLEETIKIQKRKEGWNDVAIIDIEMSKKTQYE